MEQNPQDPQDPQRYQQQQYQQQQPVGSGRPLRRPYHDRMVAGVAAGIAEQTGFDVTLVRIVMAVLCVVGGLGIPLYLAAWLLVPDEGQEQSIASEWLGHVH
jgi:phage shock protein PspC (stress-responsive transcriptional regulator)